MLTVNTLEVLMLGSTRESLLTLTSTSGGDSETLENAEIVIARGDAPSSVVTTVTPLGHEERAALKSVEDTVTVHLPIGPHPRLRKCLLDVEFIGLVGALHDEAETRGRVFTHEVAHD